MREREKGERERERIRERGEKERVHALSQKGNVIWGIRGNFEIERENE